MIKGLSLLIAFLVELAMLAALAYWGFAMHDSFLLEVITGVGIPLIVITAWSKWLAPNSKARLALSWRAIVKAILYAAATLALFDAGKETWMYLFVGAAFYSVVFELFFESRPKTN